MFEFVRREKRKDIIALGGRSASVEISEDDDRTLTAFDTDTTI
jgi:hypothetical protein